MVRHHHAVRVAGRAHTLDVRDGRGAGEAHAPSGVVGPPAQVCVLQVHEVGLVEAAELFERPATRQKARPRDPAGPGDDVPLRRARVVALGERVVRLEHRQQRVARHVGERREGPHRGVDLAGVGEDPRPDQRPGWVRLEGVRATRRACRGAPRGRGSRRAPTPATTPPASAARPRFTPAPYPRLAPGRTTRPRPSPTSSPNAASAEPGAPFSTTTIVAAPSSRSERAQPESNGPVSWSTTTAATASGTGGTAGAGATSGSELLGEAELISARIALYPSRQVIFLPSLGSRPA